MIKAQSASSMNAELVNAGLTLGECVTSHFLSKGGLFVACSESLNGNVFIC